MAQKELDEGLHRAGFYVPQIENYIDVWHRMSGDWKERLIRLAATKTAQVEVLNRELARTRAELTRLKRKGVKA